jgi:hypothetical protein
LEKPATVQTPELSARHGVSRYYRDFAEAKADSESIVNADAVWTARRVGYRRVKIHA